MILAAGRGERLRPITDSIPKALVEVAGRSLLDYQLARLAAVGVRRVVINLDWLGEQIVEHVADGSRWGLQVTYSPEYGDVLETAGGIRRALPMLGSDPFWVLNADVFTDFPLTRPALKSALNAHLLLVPTPSFKSSGDFNLEAGMVRNATDPQYTFSGFAYYRPEFFASLKPGRAALGPLLKIAADNGELSGSLLPGVWEDVGTPERLADVCAALETFTRQ